MSKSKRSTKILIIDDESLAREKLKKNLRSLPNVEVVGEADSVALSKKMIASEEPDIVLLDIHLGRESGFDIVPAIPGKSHIIFVTAYDNYAVRAFEINALDYLLKPVQPNRLEEAIKRATNKDDTIEKKEMTFLSFAYDDSVFINTPKVCKFLKFSTITSIDAEGSYSRIYEKSGKNYLMHKSLNSWEGVLPTAHFIRIHRSHIVNKNYIEDVEKWFNYTYRVTVKNRNEKLAMSRRRASDLKLT